MSKSILALRGFLLSVAVLGVLAMPAAASAAEWSLGSAPAADNSSTSVSCATSTFCLAVGKANNGVSNGASEFGLAHQWNGTEWTLQESPTTIPSEARSDSLSGVSCPSSEVCEAVGEYINGSGTEVTLAERWKQEGIKPEWSVQTTPNPTEATNSKLSAVSCTSSTACTAVGSYTKTSFGRVTLAERWNGTEWKTQTTTNPAKDTAELSGVSCSSSSECIAVGHYRYLEGEIEHWKTLAEKWNGTEWTTMTTPNSITGQLNNLASVSCSASAACTAVGWSQTEAGVRTTLAERWNGTEWKIQTTKNPTGTNVNLAGVSCPTSTTCFAVGHYLNSEGVEVTLSEGSVSGLWVILTTPNPTGAKGSELAAVSCISSEECMSVGKYNASGKLETSLGERYASSAWKVVSMPGADNGSVAVSCHSSTECIEVGRAGGEYTEGPYKGLGGEFALADGWNGTEWTVQATATPSGARRSALSGVACASSEACTAVGHYVSSSGKETALAERWKKGAAEEWAVQTVPVPEKVVSSLFGVSCTASTACTAVGSDGFGLAERWNGTEWLVQTTPNPMEGGKPSVNDLFGVSCASASECMAVGDYRFLVEGFEHRGTLAERWNGTEWIILTTPNPSEGRFNNLLGVSCSAAAACTAVGYTTTSAGVRTTLAERWNGTEWKIQTTPNPTGGESDALASVSCISATSCRAVGHYTNSSKVEVTLAEAWNGTEWTIQTTPNPTGAKGSGLAGVSCTSTEACMSVGHYRTGEKLETTLVERYL